MVVGEIAWLRQQFQLFIRAGYNDAMRWQMVVTGFIALQEFEGFSLCAYQLGNDQREIGWLFSVVRPETPSEHRYWVVKEDFYPTLHQIAFDGPIRTIETTTPPVNETMDQAERTAMLRAIAEYKPLDLSSVKRRIPGQ